MGGMQGGFGEVFKKAPSAVSQAALPKIPEVLSGDVTGDATNTDVPGLLGPIANPNQSSFSFSPLHQPQGGNNSLMDELFPGMSAEEAAEGQGMSMEEFMPWLQSMGSK